MPGLHRRRSPVDRVPDLRGLRMDRARRLRHGASERLGAARDTIPTPSGGWAFGCGVERIAMVRHGIDDIRVLFDNETDFLKQLA